MGLDSDGRRKFAPAQHLDQRTLANQTSGQKDLRRDLAQTRFGDGVKVDALIFDPERVGEAAKLRNPLDQGHLPAFEAHPNGVAGALTFGTTACGLAALATDTTGLALGSLV